MKRGLVILSLLAIAHAADAKCNFWFFQNRRYYPALIAGVREPHISALALARGDKVEFQLEPDSPRTIWDIDVGAEIPLLGCETSDTDPLPSGDFGVGLWIPIDFHMIEDFRDKSAPIVNTDYRFGGMIKFKYGLEKGRSLSARLHVGHESTHLGDEFSINAQRRYGRNFERINVSWEYIDLGVMYDVPRAWNVRGGITSTLPFGDSYYLIGEESVTTSPEAVTPSENWFDPYAGFEAIWKRLIPSENHDGYDGYVSTEIRWRSIYDYHKDRPDSAESRQASVNIIAGVKLAGNDVFGHASPFVRYYRGVNPHGQFRNQKDYVQYGIGLRLVR